MFRSAILLMCVALAYASEIRVQERTIVFHRQDNGLDWPMPDNYNPGILMVHGRHCYDIMVETANKTGEMTKMHREHCRDLLSKILYLFESNPAHRVDPWICEALTGESFNRMNHQQNLLEPENGISYGIKYADAQSNGNPAPKAQNLLKPDNGISYGIDYDPKTSPKGQNLLEPDNGISYGINYDNSAPQAPKVRNLLKPDNGISYGIDYDPKTSPKGQNLLKPDNGISYGINYADAAAQTKPAKAQNLLKPDNGISYGINYDNAQAKDQATPKFQNLLQPDNGFDYGIKYDAASPSKDLLKPDNGISYGINYDHQPKVAPKTQNLLAPDNGISYGINYVDAKPKTQNLLAPDNGISYGIDYKDQSSPLHPWTGFTRSLGLGVVTGDDENTLLVKLMADNFGDLLMKNWTSPHLINQAEHKYLAQWKSESAVSMGAVGLYCHVKGDIEAVRKMAAQE